MPDAMFETADPFALFEAWFAEAKAGEPNDPDAMTLATVDASGAPDARIVLLKAHGPEGFVFYTNRQSAKGQELAAHPAAALVLHWKSLRRQVRVRGPVSLASDGMSDAYFASRSRASRLSAIASEQSRPLDSRETLERFAAEVGKRYEGADPPRPPHWGGYVVTPLAIEFWRDGAHRLHDRRLFTRADAERGLGEQAVVSVSERSPLRPIAAKANLRFDVLSDLRQAEEGEKSVISRPTGYDSPSGLALGHRWRRGQRRLIAMTGVLTRHPLATFISRRRSFNRDVRVRSS